VDSEQPIPFIGARNVVFPFIAAALKMQSVDKVSSNDSDQRLESVRSAVLSLLSALCPPDSFHERRLQQQIALLADTQRIVEEAYRLRKAEEGWQTDADFAVWLVLVLGHLRNSTRNTATLLSKIDLPKPTVILKRLPQP
jgi:hypothetical protein